MMDTFGNIIIDYGFFGMFLFVIQYCTLPSIVNYTEKEKNKLRMCCVLLVPLVVLVVITAYYKIKITNLKSMFIVTGIYFVLVYLEIILKNTKLSNLKNLKLETAQKFIAITSLIVFSLIILSLGSTAIAKYGHYNVAMFGKPFFKGLYNPKLVIRVSLLRNVTKNQDLNLILLNTGSALLILSAIYFFLLNFALEKKTEETHGSARWGTEAEYEKEKLLCETEKYSDGVILGRTKKKLFSKPKTFCDNAKTHIAVVAPTRSGKGVGIIIPTLLNWRESSFTLDLKGENYHLTAGYRKEVMKHTILKFAPYDYYESVSYNPLAEVRIGSEYEVKDATIIANILTDPGEGKKRDHWHSNASTLLVGLILMVCYKAYDKGRYGNFGDIVDFLTNTDKPLDEAWIDLFQKETLKTYNKFIKSWKKVYGEEEINLRKEGIHPIVARTGAEISNKEPKERAGVISTAMEKLILFKDPVIRKNTSNVDFRISDLMDHTNPVDMYVVVEAESMDTLSPLLRILVTQIIGVLAPKIDYTKEKPHKYKLLLMLDEFPAFGTIPLLEKALAYIAGYGMKAVVIAQALNQIRKNYGDKNSVFDNCATTVFYACTPLDETTPRQISELLGETTIKVKNKSWQRFKFGNVNISESNQARKLLTPEEVRNKLGGDRNIISVAGMYPYMGIKIRYYEEPYFLEKTKFSEPKIERIKKEAS